MKYKKKINLVDYPLFSISDSSVFCDNEVIYNNCDDETKIFKAQEFLENIKSQKMDIKEKNKNNNSKIENIKKDNIVEDDTINVKKKSSETETILLKKRKSYRAKAQDFNNKNNGNRKKKIKKDSKKIKQIESLSDVKNKNDKKIENTDKKQGWWNQ